MDLGSTIGELQEAPLAVVVVVRGGCLPDFFFGEGRGTEQRSGGRVVFFLSQIALVIGVLTAKVRVGVRRCLSFEGKIIFGWFGDSWWHLEPIILVGSV